VRGGEPLRHPKSRATVKFFRSLWSCVAAQNLIHEMGSNRISTR
jgi:hypothetical protein